MQESYPHKPQSKLTALLHWAHTLNLQCVPHTGSKETGKEKAPRTFRYLSPGETGEECPKRRRGCEVYKAH